jgi:hypothetical protein
MESFVCRQCGEALVPDTNFCRKCGAAISRSDVLPENERSTRLFDEGEVVATQRLDPRPTASERARFDARAQPARTAERSKFVLIAVVSLLVLAAIVSTIAVVKNRRNGRVTTAEAALYPGSTKTMDIVGEGGGRAVALETSDSFEQVSQWYQMKLRPEKVVQLTERSVVMKGASTTATIIGDENRTSVLLKIIP